MDITYWISEGEEQPNDNKWAQQHLIKLLSDKYKKESKISLQDYMYLLYKIKNVNLINCQLFSKIICSLEDSEIIKQVNLLFSHLYDVNGKVNITQIIDNFIDDNKDKFKPTTDQYNALTKIIKYITDNDKFLFGLYGYAGTGKTTILTEIIHYLLSNKLIKSVVFSAPTNKAVDVCKTKFMKHVHNLYNVYKQMDSDKKDKKRDNQLKDDDISLMNELADDKDKIIHKKEELTQIKDELIPIKEEEISLDDMLSFLETKGLTIDFITIHKLLNYKTDFDITGEKMFIKQTNNLMDQYELIIIDECSMIQLELISNIFDELYGKANVNSKIIFSGDTAQLPPVNELNSSIFIKKKSDITEKDFIRAFPPEIQEIMILDKEKIKNKIDLLTDHILAIDCIIMKEIVRNTNNNVNDLCCEIRQWIDNEIRTPQFGKYVDKQIVYAYKKPEDKEKTDSKWFRTFIAELRGGQNNIILAWTNRLCDLYNSTARSIMFGDKKVINEYEIGDILILTEFHDLGEETFHTSEQIYVHHVEPDIYVRPLIKINLTKTALKMKNIIHIEQQLNNTINQLNTMIADRYQIWKLYVYRLSDVKQKNTIPNNHIIKVIQSTSNNLWNMNKNTCSELVRKLRNKLKKEFKTQISSIDVHIIKPLWKEINKTLISPFANVNYGFAITTHKSQGSTYYNIFVDVDDILSNKNDNEAKRCLYTSLTRSSNKIHLLF